MKTTMKGAVLVLLVFGCGAQIVAPVMAHGGGLNRYGCHNDNIRGGYHCHSDGEEKVNWCALAAAAVLTGVLLYALSESARSNRLVMREEVTDKFLFERPEGGVGVFYAPPRFDAAREAQAMIGFSYRF